MDTLQQNTPLSHFPALTLTDVSEIVSRLEATVHQLFLLSGDGTSSVVLYHHSGQGETYCWCIKVSRDTVQVLRKRHLLANHQNKMGLSMWNGTEKHSHSLSVPLNMLLFQSYVDDWHFFLSGSVWNITGRSNKRAPMSWLDEEVNSTGACCSLGEHQITITQDFTEVNDTFYCFSCMENHLCCEPFSHMLKQQLLSAIHVEMRVTCEVEGSTVDLNCSLGICFQESLR